MLKQELCFFFSLEMPGHDEENKFSAHGFLTVSFAFGKYLLSLFVSVAPPDAIENVGKQHLVFLFIHKELHSMNSRIPAHTGSQAQ